MYSFNIGAGGGWPRMDLYRLDKKKHTGWLQLELTNHQVLPGVIRGLQRLQIGMFSKTISFYDFEYSPVRIHVGFGLWNEAWEDWSNYNFAMADDCGQAKRWCLGWVAGWLCIPPKRLGLAGAGSAAIRNIKCFDIYPVSGCAVSACRGMSVLVPMLTAGGGVPRPNYGRYSRAILIFKEGVRPTLGQGHGAKQVTDGILGTSL